MAAKFGASATTTMRTSTRKARTWRISAASRDTVRPPQPREVRLTRSDVVGKAVITRTSGLKLGVVRQAWVDASRWELVSLDVAPNALAIGESSDAVMLQSLRQVGDVVLVHDESVLESNLSTYGLNTLVGCELVTESGEYLGRVRDYLFHPDSGKVVDIVFDSLGVPLIPDSIVSTYSLNVVEVVTAGPGRIIAKEGAERRLEQLTSGIAERLGIDPPWAESYGYDYEPYGYGMEEYDRVQPRRYPEDTYMPGEPRRRERPVAMSKGRTGYNRDGPERRVRRADPRARDPERGRNMADDSPSSSKTVQIPLYDFSDRRPAYQRRDADGRLGEIASRREPRPASKRFDQWVVEETSQARELEEAGMDMDAGRGTGFASRREQYDASEDRI